MNDSLSDNEYGDVFWFVSFFSFLTKSKKDLELRKWAAEGLSFLTMDADVKVR